MQIVRQRRLRHRPRFVVRDPDFNYRAIPHALHAMCLETSLRLAISVTGNSQRQAQKQCSATVWKSSIGKSVLHLNRFFLLVRIISCQHQRQRTTIISRIARRRSVLIERIEESAH